MAERAATNPIDIVVPAHNEGASIGATLRHFHAAVAPAQPIRFIVCEDGSRDDTVDVLRALQAEMPLHLITARARKGYTAAMLDGLRATTAAWVAMMDADGVYDPADFLRLLAAREGADMVIGIRTPRADPLFRRVISDAFGLVYRALFPVRLRDPSCSFLVINRAGLATILAGQVGTLRQGFIWEFAARAQAAGLRIAEIPVTHRERAAGVTQVYRLAKLPRIAVEHLAGLVRLRRELRAAARHEPASL